MDAPHRQANLWSKTIPFLPLLPLLACFAAIQLGTNRFGGNDGYYHIKYAWLLWHEGAIWDFPWLRGTFFHESWVDSEFLFHVLLIPFTLFGDLYLAGKSAPAVLGSIALFSVYWRIREYGEPDSAWRKYAGWSILVLLAASSVSLYRLSMPRAPAASLTFMMVGLMLMERRQWKWLAVLGFFYAWMYPVSVVLIPLALFHAISIWYDEDRWTWRPITAAAGGVFVGFIINPYFPATLPLLFNHVVEIGIGTSDIPKGNEWSPYDSWFMFRTALVAWIALFAGGLCMIGTPARGRHIATLAATAMMMLAYFKSRRFVEYWPFFAILFSAATFHDALAAKESLVNRVRSALGSQLVPVGVMIVSALLVGNIVKNIRRTTRDVASNAEPTRLAGATKWLRENTSPGAQVYNAQWDVFPELIFYNHHNYWTLGLDPNFTHEVSPSLYYTSVALERGRLSEPGRYIENHFGADYAVSINKTSFTGKAKSVRSGLKKVFEDENASVYEIVPIDRLRTIEAELEPYETELSREDGRCKYREERPGGSGARAYFLQCRLKEAQPVVLRYKTDLPQAGLYSVSTRFLTGATKGRVEFYAGDAQLGEAVDLAGDKRALNLWKNLGRTTFPAGPIVVEARFYPENPQDMPATPSKKPSRWPVEVGLDAIRFSFLRR